MLLDSYCSTYNDLRAVIQASTIVCLLSSENHKAVRVLVVEIYINIAEVYKSCLIEFFLQTFKT